MSTMIGGHGGNGGNVHGGRTGWLRVVLATAAILLVPLVAMRFTDEVNWSAGDFLVAAVLLLAAGSALDLILRKVPGVGQRLLGAGLLGLAFVYAWAELAVGIFFHFGN